MTANFLDVCAELIAAEGHDPRVGAFFDLDHTLLHGSSGMLFVRYMLRTGRMSRRQALSIIREAILYKMGRADFTASSREMIRLVAGESEEEMWRLSRLWFDEMVAGRVTEAARDCVRRHQELAHQVALLSASTPFATVLAAQAVGLQPADAISTQLEILDGVITGEEVEPMCFGEGKFFWANRYAEEREIDLERSFFYTDSYSDVPMLRKVGHPVIVNPDRRLRRLALKEGWPIVRFY